MGDGKPSEGEGDHYAPPALPTNDNYRHARWPRFNDDPVSARTRAGHRAQPDRASPDVLVVGVCSAGKSTLVRTLRELGYDARACAQEHSYVPNLWSLSSPGALVYLDASLPTIRRRGRASWDETLLEQQHYRLRHAREHCDLFIATDDLRPEDVAAKVIKHLRGREPGRSDAEHQAK